MYEDELEDDYGRNEEIEQEFDDEQELDPEEELAELDVDDRGHVRPRRKRSRFDEYDEEPVLFPDEEE
jgi:hypothetical protein